MDQRTECRGIRRRKVGQYLPIQLHVGTREVLLDDTLRYVARAREAGVDATAHVWEGMTHVFQSSVGSLDAADKSLNIMAGFLTSA